MTIKKKSMFSFALQVEKKFYLAVILLEIVTYTFSFLFSGLAKKDIFNILERKKVTLGIHSLWILILLNVAIPLLINGVKQLNSGLVAKIETRMMKNVKVNLLEQILGRKLGADYIHKYGETISLFRNECEDVVRYLMEYYYQIPKIVLCAAILITMICINPMFAIISLIPTFGMVAFNNFLGKHIVANREATRKSTSQITEYLENLYGNIEYFRLAVNQEKLVQIFRNKCEVRSGNEIKDRVLDQVLGIVSENSANFVLGIVLLISIPLYRQGILSVGEFVMFGYYYAFLSSLPDAVGRLIRRYKQYQVAVKRLQFDKGEEYEGTAQYSKEQVYVAVSYKERQVEVTGKKGQVILIRGGNENERSCLLQRIFQICTEKIPDMSSQYIPQQPVLFHDSILHNICLGEPLEENKMNWVLQETDLSFDIQNFEDGIQKDVGKQGATVSGGQRKRISIARALYAGADMLFIDCLSEAVDRRTEEILISNILNINKYIVFVSSNSQRVVEKAAHVIEI